jgi:hypothetical protein
VRGARIVVAAEDAARATMSVGQKVGFPLSVVGEVEVGMVQRDEARKSLRWRDIERESSRVAAIAVSE